MASLFFVLVLYQIPPWFGNPRTIVSFLLVLAAGLGIDFVWNMIRYKRITCGVSAAVTVGIVYSLYPNIPLWGSLLGVTAALVVGKHLWGGTGRNIFNPALIGALVLSVIFPEGIRAFTLSAALIPAVILSLPFVLVRPFASLGLILGVIVSMGIQGTLTLSDYIASGVIFWGAIVVTDPVTITHRPVVGAAWGLMLGFGSLFFGPHLYSRAMIPMVLIFNAVSFLVGKYPSIPQTSRIRRVKIDKIVPKFAGGRDAVPDCDGQEAASPATNLQLSAEEILGKIQLCKVVGLGGAAFPTHQKIQRVIESDAKSKYLVVNAAECDPGLIHDSWLLGAFPKEVSKGIQLLCACVGLRKVVLATKDVCNWNAKGVEVITVPDLYPIGAERILIRNVLGIQLPDDMIPASAGILILNLQTIYGVYEAVYLNKKATSKYITIANLKKNEAKPVQVKLGGTIKDVVAAVYPGEGPVFVGGGLMQSRPVRDDDVIEVTTNFIAVSDAPYYKESSSCSKCGLCVRKCVSNLEVYKIADLVDRGQIAATYKYNPEKCISCGTCSYYCLAGRNLSHRLQSAKSYCNRAF